ncbi:long-chain-fatty-acid--CoA ligase 1-like [Lethenteron reissneri]|uniref:long-chain-fatty-acid--CoA ligase 1-like n=1 Tax=Lethenteron reissneri TaxID=7753 RepID=UPI002AB621B6|nr:long-chain-fatty-acid--CoA ligase 1-like [Lethenteron reissneri]
MQSAQEVLKTLRVPELDEVRQYVRSLPAPALMGLGALGTMTAYWLATRPRALSAPCDLSKQSLPVKGLEYVRRSTLVPDDNTFFTYFYEDARTGYEVFQRGLRMSNNGPCLGHRKPNHPYEWISYKETSDRAEYLGSGFLHRGAKPSSEQVIGIFSQNRPEWIIAEQACYTYSLVVVPLYDTLGRESIDYIISQAEISTVVCDKLEKVKGLLESIEEGAIRIVKTIVVMEPFDGVMEQRARNCGVDLILFRELEVIGKTNHRKPIPPQPDDIAIICYTSGTTGNPKGAMLTHKNMISDFSAFLAVTKDTFLPNKDDVLISFLPLAHMFERLVEASIFCNGGRVGFYQGDIRLLMDDMKVLQPTVFPVVPRLLNRIYDKVLSGAKSHFKRWLLDFAVSRKMAELRCGVVRKDSIWDKLIFHRVQASMGGRVRFMVTGAAPISASILTFLRAILGCQVYEGFGQTECTAGCTFTMPSDSTAGHVGPPMPCNHIKVVDVADMNYFAANGEGEVCVYGTNVFKGYLKDPTRTAEALDEDGWLHTGDIGKWLPNGTLKIVDRKKHIFKLSQGEYIAPEKIETVYVRSEPVAQVFVHGDSLQSCLVCIVVPDMDVLPSWVQKRGIKCNPNSLFINKDVRAAILHDMVRLGKEAGLKSFEQVRAVHLHSDLFSIENGLLTPTFKVKRAEVSKFFHSEIDNLYAGITV